MNKYGKILKKIFFTLITFISRYISNLRKNKHDFAFIYLNNGARKFTAHLRGSRNQKNQCGKEPGALPQTQIGTELCLIFD